MCHLLFIVALLKSANSYIYALLLHGFSSIIKNPGDAEYLEVIAAGEAATWPFFSRIKAHCHVEMTLDRYQCPLISNPISLLAFFAYPRVYVDVFLLHRLDSCSP